MLIVILILLGVFFAGIFLSATFSYKIPKRTQIGIIIFLWCLLIIILILLFVATESKTHTQSNYNININEFPGNPRKE